MEDKISSSDMTVILAHMGAGGVRLVIWGASKEYPAKPCPPKKTKQASKTRKISHYVKTNFTKELIIRHIIGGFTLCAKQFYPSQRLRIFKRGEEKDITLPVL